MPLPRDVITPSATDKHKRVIIHLNQTLVPAHSTAGDVAGFDRPINLSNLSAVTRQTAISIPVNNDIGVSGIATVPQAAEACLILAHGAGAGMTHPFLVTVCDGLAARRIATLRYQFAYMEKGSRRPDPPALCHEAVRRAVAAAHKFIPELPLFAGGKSFGGRMTSQAQAAAPMSGIRGLCFFGFPLHPPKQPAITRAEHLASIQVPMLFLQGTRDEMAKRDLMAEVIARLTAPVRLEVIDHADHSFHVPARSGTTDGNVMNAMLDAVAAWMVVHI